MKDKELLPEELIRVKSNGDIDCSLLIATTLKSIDESLKKIAEYLKPVKLDFDCIQAKTAEIDPHFGVPVMSANEATEALAEATVTLFGKKGD